ncbi:arginase [Pusillimonas sp. ANT_WB101]|uniref:arginase n=1 Tax=Pusillimonas sp. ANT_WB101 TaxID=2597356 RepID=UPI0011EE34E6|nr:arginase [Pusillimonas sp. ANT_WB101]KAA0891029.1 arginase [Pusillimonas sp. ANT_WB101]
MRTAAASRAAQPSVSLIGAPSDAGAANIGSCMGPEALRVAQLGSALETLGIRVSDLGNLSGPPNPRGPRDKPYGLRNLAECTHWNHTVFDAVLNELDNGQTPIMLGGDHHLAIGSISAVAQHCRKHGKLLRVLWLDAHADCNTPEISPSGNVHGIPVACLHGMGPEQLTTLAGSAPALTSGELKLIGLRSVDDAEKQMIRALSIEAYDMRLIDELGMYKVMRRALRDIRQGNVHLHVSFDVDFLDPSIAPGTGTTVCGGPGYREAQLCMEMIAETACLGSLDVVELNPALDVRNQTATLVVELIQSLFGKTTLLRSV